MNNPSFMTFIYFVASIAWTFLGLLMYESIFGKLPPIRPKLRQYPLLILFGGPFFIVVVAVSFVFNKLAGAEKPAFLKRIIDWQNS